MGKDTVTLNVEIPLPLHHALVIKKAEHGARTWEEFFDLIVQKQLLTDIKLLAVGDTPILDDVPSPHTILLRVGDRFCHWSKGDCTFTELSDEQAQRLLDRALAVHATRSIAQSLRGPLYMSAPSIIHPLKTPLYMSVSC